MPSLAGFSDNPFRTRSDLIRAASVLLQPLEQYKSTGGARIKIGTSTGAGFSETASQLEGFARPLWVVADLLRLESTNPALNSSSPSFSSLRLESWIQGLKTGTDPQSSEYWGDVSNFDQRMVEMESIAYAMLSNPEAFRFAHDPTARSNIINWMRQLNDHKMPQNNWQWFRVLMNLSLVRTMGIPLEEVKHHIEDSLRVLDSFYIGNGWSSDGLWGEERKQADYYSGSFAIQFAQLLFVKFASDYDPLRSERYRKDAGEFASEYWRYFSPNGAAIPFGRSLTYRFAFAAFWAAVATADIQIPLPLGVVKGILLRHLRWWAKQPHIFNTDGTINIGYCYPNMYLAEDYNSPQSVFWCLKSFIILGLPESHPFWMENELPHPMTVSASLQLYRPHTAPLWPPRHILCNTPEHHFLLSSGQSTSKRFKAREAKYGKFAYSSAFGFSVPCGPFLEQQAPDSTLAVSFASEENWKVRWDPTDVHLKSLQVGSEKVETLNSAWKPWKKVDFEVQTTLIPPMIQWPGWHLRVHRVSWSAPKGSDSMEPIHVIDAGFAISAQTSNDVSIFESAVRNFADECGDDQEGWWIDKQGALVISGAGACGIADLTSDFTGESVECATSESTVIRADPNTNLISQRTLIPVVKHLLKGTAKSETISKQTRCGDYLWLVTGVFAVEASASVHAGDLWKLWHSRPKGRIATEREAGIFLDAA